MKSLTDKDFKLTEIEDQVEAQLAGFFAKEVGEEFINSIEEKALWIANQESANKAVIDDFLSQLPTDRCKLYHAIISHATYDKFPTHAMFIHDEGLEKNGMQGFYSLSDRVAFHEKHKELFKACIEEVTESLRYLTVLDWYIRLDYPSYQAGTTEGFELTNELMTKVFVDLDSTNIEYEGMIDALVRELLLEIASSFMQFTTK